MLESIMKTRTGLKSFFALLLATAFTFSGAGVFAQSLDDVVLNVYKEVTCGCCNGWIEHMDANGYTSNIFHPVDLNAVKAELGIKPEWQSCHTAVTEEGFLFEGHIPQKFITQFLASPPEGALGLTVPGMPLGAPGMEMGDRFIPYDIVLMNKDGSSKVYASIKSKDDQ